MKAAGMPTSHTTSQEPGLLTPKFRRLGFGETDDAATLRTRVSIGAAADLDSVRRISGTRAK